MPIEPRQGEDGLTYEHTQKGTAAVVVVSLVFAVAVVVAVPALSSGRTSAIGLWLPFGLIMAIVAVTLLLFTRLTVRIDETELHWSFGFGFPKFSMPLADIDSTSIVTNPVLYGYGIRVIAKGMLYNVSGTSAVEVVRRNRRVVRIGTDEPEALKRAIDSALSMQPAA
jgi:hypothetical protein